MIQPTVASAARTSGLALAMLVAAAATSACANEPDPPAPAKVLFGAVSTPSDTPAARAIGSYAKGCLAGGMALATDGPSWQAMRLSRNRNWGHPELIRFIRRLAAAARADGWPGLLVGDLAQPRGGPMATGHASHQIGLDADIWLTPMPDYRLPANERESRSAISMLRSGTRRVDPARFGPRQVALLRRTASYPEVTRIFVHPGIKQALCERAGQDRGWLGKVRPWYGHDSHFHVRLRCPADEPMCRDQDPPPTGDGCGAELSWWLSDEPWRPKPDQPPTEPLLLADLPQECRSVLAAP